MEKEKKTVSLEQFEGIVEYMEAHLDFARGRCKSKEGRALAHRRWTELSYTVNSINTPRSMERTAEEWAKYFTDYKSRLNGKIKALRASQARTGGGQGEANPLSPLDLRLAAVLGHRPNEPNYLEEARQMPIMGLEHQQQSEDNTEADPQVNQQQLEFEVEEIPHDHDYYYDPAPNAGDSNVAGSSAAVSYAAGSSAAGFSAAGSSAAGLSAAAPRHAQRPTTEQVLLLDMGRQQAEALNRLAQAIESMMPIAERMATAFEQMASALCNIAGKYNEK